MSGDAILTIEDVAVDFSGVHALQGVSLTVRHGRIVTLIGSNGAGKTTLMRSIAGLQHISRGSIMFRGMRISGMQPDRIVALGIALVPEGRRLFPSMTVRENLELGAYLRADSAAVARDFERVLEYFPALKDRLDTTSALLSGGQQQMVSIGRALMAAPRLLLLDEPSVGLAPAVVNTIARILRTIAESEIDVLLVEQNAGMALALAQEAYVIEGGAITMSGKANELEQLPAIKEAYLGA